MILKELFQRILLSAMSWYHGETDVFNVACRVTNTVYPEYSETFCLDRISNEEVQREISTLVYYPDATPPFPGILLVSGSSSATSDSMMERKEFFLKNGFAVMILNSFTPMRILEDCFRKAEPCKTYQEVSSNHWNDTVPFSRQCPAVTDPTIGERTSLMFKNYMDRVVAGHTLSPAERTHDLFEALHIFRRDENIDSTNLAIAGYSHGGSTVLEALTFVENKIPPPGDAHFSSEEHSLEGVRAAIVYYPNCCPGTYFQWHAATKEIPVQVHLSDRDEYVSPELCRSTVDKINDEERSTPIHTYHYDEKHAFDMKEYSDAYNEQSKNLAYQRVLEFIRNSIPQK